VWLGPVHPLLLNVVLIVPLFLVSLPLSLALKDREFFLRESVIAPGDALRLVGSGVLQGAPPVPPREGLPDVDLFSTGWTRRPARRS
jgi:hypothetical protein